MLGFYQDVWEICFVGPYCQLCSAHVKSVVKKCRLAKRWMWSHLFSGVISDEVVELLVVYTFVKSARNGPPSS